MSIVFLRISMTRREREREREKQSKEKVPQSGHTFDKGRP